MGRKGAGASALDSGPRLRLNKPMSDTAKGMAAIVAATMIWGLSPLFYKQLAGVPPLEVLAHRTLWSMVFFGALLAVRGRLGTLVALLRDWRALRLVALSSLLISVNWFVFIDAIQIGRAMEASLGYYIFPLVAVGLGRAFFGEGLSRPGAVAIALALVAVVTLTLGLGAAPWISLVLAVTFGFYGVVKKGFKADPVVSVTAEVALLTPLALLWLWGVHRHGWGAAAFGGDPWETLLLILSGIITALPLVLFSSAARHLPLGLLGVLQYINPTLQFLVSALIFAEPVTPSRRALRGA